MSTNSRDDLIRQLTPDDLRALELLCQPYDSEGPVVLQRTLVLSMLNEIHYHRGRREAGTLHVESIVSMRDGKPYVKFTFGNTEVQLSALEAIEHARKIMEVSSGAMADGFLTKYLRRRVDLAGPRVSMMLADFRAYRVDELGEDPGDEAEDEP